VAIIDTLKLARELRDKGGFTQEAAEATAEALNNALGAELATKADIDRLGAATKADIDRLAAATKADIDRLEMRIDQLATSAATKVDLVNLRAELLKWVLGVGIAATLAVGGMIWTATQVLLRAVHA
jgi:hypothetical protein